MRQNEPTVRVAFSASNYATDTRVKKTHHAHCRQRARMRDAPRIALPEVAVYDIPTDVPAGAARWTGARHDGMCRSRLSDSKDSITAIPLAAQFRSSDVLQ